MALCERCGHEMPDTAAVCPSCGTVASASWPGAPSPDTFGQNPSSSPSSYYAQGYSQQYGYSEPQPQTDYAQAQGGYAQQQEQMYAQSQPYQMLPIMVNINMPVVTPVAAPRSAATVVEVLLTIFLGIYGVGWLMAGEITTGIILLICSIFLYWPVVVLGTIFTFGLGLICIVPLAIGAIILNAVLLSDKMKRKATAYVLVQPVQPIRPFPPR